MAKKHVFTGCVAALAAACVPTAIDDPAPPPDENEIGNSIIGLVPDPANANANDYCVRDGTELRVTFRNSGNIANTAGQKKAVVRFSTRNGPVEQEQDLPVIQPGQQASLLFTIPGRCFSPDCSFGIGGNITQEAGGTCLG